MNHLLSIRTPTGSTPNQGPALFGLKVGATVLVGVLWAANPLTTSSSNNAPDARLVRAAMQTTPGLAVESERRRSASEALSDLRRVAGLTWEQLARLFGVSRRAVHFWSSGESMSAANEERLHRTAAVVRAMDRGSAPENRALLFASHGGARSAFDLLTEGRYDEASRAVGQGEYVRPMPLSRSSGRRTYETMEPVALLDAVNEIGPVKVGKTRTAKTSRV